VPFGARVLHSIVVHRENGVPVSIEDRHMAAPFAAAIGYQRRETLAHRWPIDSLLADILPKWLRRMVVDAVHEYASPNRFPDNQGKIREFRRFQAKSPPAKWLFSSLCRVLERHFPVACSRETFCLMSSFEACTSRKRFGLQRLDAWGYTHETRNGDPVR